jgi:hypothetical protein
LRLLLLLSVHLLVSVWFKKGVSNAVGSKAKKSSSFLVSTASALNDDDDDDDDSMSSNSSKLLSPPPLPPPLCLSWFVVGVKGVASPPPPSPVSWPCEYAEFQA